MKRDITVTISLVIFAITWGISWLLDMPQEITNDDPLRFHVLFWVMFVCAARGSVLWFQTLLHAVRSEPAERRVGWILAHIFLTVFASCYYYFTVTQRTDKATQPEN